MENQLWGVLLGASVASIVPLITLHINQAQWRLEKRIELFRSKKTDLERIYADILQQLPVAMVEGNHPINMMGRISVNASEEVRKLYFNHMDSKERDPTKMKHLFLMITIAANNHIASVEQEINNLLK